MRVLDAPCLRLRPLADDDEAFYCRLYADPAVMRLVAPPLSPEAARRSFAAVRRSARRPAWIIEERGAGLAIGLVGLAIDGDGAEIGALLLPRWQGRGHAAAALAAVADHAFAEAGLERLWTRHAADNAGAAGLMRRLGFARLPDGADGRWRWRMDRPCRAQRRG